MPLATSGAQRMTLRRAPNIWAFVVLGGVVGIVIGIAVGVLGAGNPQFTTGTVVLFMVSVFAIVGLGAGAVVALVLERLSVARAQAVTAEVVAEEARSGSAAEELRTEAADQAADQAAGTGSVAEDTGTASVDGRDPAGPRADDGGPTDPRSSREG